MFSPATSEILSRYERDTLDDDDKLIVFRQLRRIANHENAFARKLKKLKSGEVVFKNVEALKEIGVRQTDDSKAFINRGKLTFVPASDTLMQRLYDNVTSNGLVTVSDVAEWISDSRMPLHTIITDQLADALEAVGKDVEKRYTKILDTILRSHADKYMAMFLLDPTISGMYMEIVKTRDCSLPEDSLVYPIEFNGNANKNKTYCFKRYASHVVQADTHPRYTAADWLFARIDGRAYEALNRHISSRSNYLVVNNEYKVISKVDAKVISMIKKMLLLIHGIEPNPGPLPCHLAPVFSLTPHLKTFFDAPHFEFVGSSIICRCVMANGDSGITVTAPPELQDIVRGTTEITVIIFRNFKNYDRDGKELLDVTENKNTKLVKEIADNTFCSVTSDVSIVRYYFEQQCPTAVPKSFLEMIQEFFSPATAPDEHYEGERSVTLYHTDALILDALVPFCKPRSTSYDDTLKLLIGEVRTLTTASSHFQKDVIARVAAILTMRSRSGEVSATHAKTFSGGIMSTTTKSPSILRVILTGSFTGLALFYGHRASAALSKCLQPTSTMPGQDSIVKLLGAFLILTALKTTTTASSTACVALSHLLIQSYWTSSFPTLRELFEATSKAYPLGQLLISALTATTVIAMRDTWPNSQPSANNHLCYRQNISQQNLFSNLKATTPSKLRELLTHIRSSLKPSWVHTFNSRTNAHSDSPIRAVASLSRTLQFVIDHPCLSSALEHPQLSALISRLSNATTVDDSLKSGFFGSITSLETCATKEYWILCETCFSATTSCGTPISPPQSPKRSCQELFGLLHSTEFSTCCSCHSSLSNHEIPRILQRNSPPISTNSTVYLKEMMASLKVLSMMSSQLRLDCDSNSKDTRILQLLLFVELLKHANLETYSQIPLKLLEIFSPWNPSTNTTNQHNNEATSAQKHSPSTTNTQIAPSSAHSRTASSNTPQDATSVGSTSVTTNNTSSTKSKQQESSGMSHPTSTCQIDPSSSAITKFLSNSNTTSKNNSHSGAVASTTASNFQHGSNSPSSMLPNTSAPDTNAQDVIEMLSDFFPTRTVLIQKELKKARTLLALAAKNTQRLFGTEMTNTILRETTPPPTNSTSNEESLVWIVLSEIRPTQDPFWKTFSGYLLLPSSIVCAQFPTPSIVFGNYYFRVRPKLPEPRMNGEIFLQIEQSLFNGVTTPFPLVEFSKRATAREAANAHCATSSTSANHIKSSGNADDDDDN